MRDDAIDDFFESITLCRSEIQVTLRRESWWSACVRYELHDPFKETFNADVDQMQSSIG